MQQKFALMIGWLCLLAVTAYAQNAPRAYVADTLSNTVSVIDTATDTRVATIPVGVSPSGVALHPRGKRLYVSNAGSDTVSVIDTATDATVATVAVGHVPSDVAVHPAGRHVYVTNESDDTVSVIDTATNAVIATVRVGTSPRGVAVHPNGLHVYVANINSQGDPPLFTGTLSVIDVATNVVTATVPVGDFSPSDVAVHPNGARLYTANFGAPLTPATLSIIDSGTNRLIELVTLGDNGVANGVTVHPDGTRVYVSSSSRDSVSVLDVATNTIEADVPVGSFPRGVTVHPDGTRVYVPTSGGNLVSVIDTATNALIRSVLVGAEPVDLAIGPGRGVLNHLVTLTAISSTFATSSDTSGCPVGSSATFHFTSTLAANTGSPELVDLQVVVQTLTNGNLLQNADSGPSGPGGLLTVRETGMFADGVLSPEESVEVPLVVCLRDRTPFSFFVDVLGNSLRTVP
jgi:YVTN family beta-propeller protein